MKRKRLIDTRQDKTIINNNNKKKKMYFHSSKDKCGMFFYF